MLSLHRRIDHGLRSYGTEPQVWAITPEQGACQHEWVTHRYYVEGGGGQRSAEAFHAPGEMNAARLKSTRWKQDDTCARCGCWRGELGAEPTVDLHIAHLVAVFREVRRVLRDDGTFWLNYGDRFNAGRNGGHPGGKQQWRDDRYQSRSGSNDEGLHAKELVGLPWMLAFALRADGWRIRQVNHWCKTAPMPESVTDRTTSAVEYVFMFWQGGKYYYDAEAVKEPSVSDHGSGNGYKRDARLSYDGRGSDEPYLPQPTRNLRNWWALGPDPFPAAHFATFPKEIPRIAISAGTSERGCCPACGAPWVRVVERVDMGGTQKMADGWDTAPGAHSTIHRTGREKGQTGVPVLANHTTGWEPGCACDAGDPVPATVLDPFGGSGTTGLVAERLGRDSILIDLKPDYVAMAAERIRGDAPLLTRVEVEA